MFEYLVNFSLIATGIIGFFVAFLMLCSYKFNRLLNIYLILIFTFVSLRFLHKGIYELFYPHLLKVTFYWLTPIFLIIIPSFYLYFKSLLNDKQYNYKDLLHFIYPLVIILYDYPLLVPLIKKIFLSNNF